MKLPEPVAYLTDAPEHKFISFFLSRDPHSKQESLYSETQVKELLAQADKDASDLMLIVHMKQAAKYDPVLKQALEALTRWKNANTFSGRINAQKPGVDAIDAIKGVLG